MNSQYTRFPLSKLRYDDDNEDHDAEANCSQSRRLSVGGLKHVQLAWTLAEMR